jgi:hypothetical protein
MGVAPYFLVYGLGKPLLNTGYSALILATNVFVIGVLELSGGVTLAAFSWAFALAQILAVLAYHVALEGFVWPYLLAAGQTLHPQEA